MSRPADSHAGPARVRARRRRGNCSTSRRNILWRRTSRRRPAMRNGPRRERISRSAPISLWPRSRSRRRTRRWRRATAPRRMRCTRRRSRKNPEQFGDLVQPGASAELRGESKSRQGGGFRAARDLLFVRAAAVDPTLGGTTDGAKITAYANSVCTRNTTAATKV